MTIDFENAISKRIELFLKVKLSGISDYQDIRLQPYIFGKDVLGFQFLWGYIPNLDVFYKILINLIGEAEELSISFTPLPNAKYIRPDGETHYCVVKGEWKYKSLL